MKRRWTWRPTERKERERERKTGGETAAGLVEVTKALVDWLSWTKAVSSAIHGMLRQSLPRDRKEFWFCWRLIVELSYQENCLDWIICFYNCYCRWMVDYIRSTLGIYLRGRSPLSVITVMYRVDVVYNHARGHTEGIQNRQRYSRSGDSRAMASSECRTLEASSMVPRRWGGVLVHRVFVCTFFFRGTSAPERRAERRAEKRRRNVVKPALFIAWDLL